MKGKKDIRGFALWYIAEYLESRLGFRKNDFLEWISEMEGGTSEKTLTRYIRGDTPMKRWTFSQFWSMVEEAVGHYLEYEEFGQSLAPHAAEIWEQEKETQEALCRLFFLDLDAPERVEDFPEHGRRLFEDAEAYKQQFLDELKPVFGLLDKAIQYKIQANFAAIATVTTEDITFWRNIQSMTAEEKEAQRRLMLQGATVDAGIMLANLGNEEMRCWVNLRDRDYRDTARNAKEPWAQFSEKFRELAPWQFPMTAWFFITPFQVACAKGEATDGKIEVQLPMREDIDLLLLFKYCLAEEERERFLTIE